MKLATLTSLVSSGGTSPNARSAQDGGASPDFGSLLNGMAKDTTAGAPPTATPGKRPDADAMVVDASAVGVSVAKEDVTVSRDTASTSAEGKPPLSEGAIATAATVAGSGVGGQRSGLTSLMTLAALAAKTAPDGSAAPATADALVPAATNASAFGSDAAVDTGAQKSGSRVRDPSKRDGGKNDQVAMNPTTMAPLPAAAAGLVAAQLPNSSDARESTSRLAVIPASVSDTDVQGRRSIKPGSDASADGGSQASGLDNGDKGQAGAASAAMTMVNSGLVVATTPDAPSVTDTTKLVSNDTAAASTRASASSANAVADTEPPSLAASVTSVTSVVDAAILPGTVRLESHLGFDRKVPFGEAGSSQGDVAGRAAVAAVQSENTQPGGVAIAAPEPGVAADGAGAAASGLADPAGARDASSSNDVALQADVPGVEGVATGSTNALPPNMADAHNISTSGVDRLPLLSSAALAPEAGAASPEAIMPAPPRLTRGRETPPSSVAGSPSVKSANIEVAVTTPASTPAISAGLVEPSPQTAPPVSQSVTDGVSGPAASVDASSKSAAPDKPATDEPDTTAPVSSTPTTATFGAGMAILSPQATPSVVQQVTSSIIGLASTAVPDEGTSLGTQVAPARTMSLQLSPAGLGTLTVRLHVTGRALDVHLEASDDRTAALISRDRETLSGALTGKDYQLQSLNVTTQDTAISGGTHAERGTDQGSPDRGASGSFQDEPSRNRSGNERSREAPAQDARSSRRATGDDVLERGGSSLFV